MPKRRRGVPLEAEVSEEEGPREPESSEEGPREPESSEEEGSDPSSSDDEEVQSEDGSDGEAFDSVTVDFDFAEPQESDFLGLKTLLTNYLDGQQYDASGLVDLVLKHSYLGTLIRCEEEVIGVTTVVPLTPHREDACVKSLLSLLRSRLDAGSAGKLDGLVGGERAGLLINERLINCPPDVAPHLQATLVEDLKEARKQVALDSLLLVARAFRERSGPTQGSKKPRRGGDKGGTELVFLQPEVECLHEQAQWVAEFPVQQADAAGPSSSRGAEPVRLAMCVPVSRLRRALGSLESLLKSSGGD